jgi:hypothetical protein
VPTSQRNALDRSVRGRAPSAERESCRAPASGSIYHHTIWCDGGPGDGQGGGAQVGGRRPRGSLKALLSIRHHGRAGTGAGCCAAIPAVWICRPSHEHAVPPQCTSSVGPGDGIHCRGRCTRVRTLLRPQASWHLLMTSVGLLMCLQSNWCTGWTVAYSTCPQACSQSAAGLNGLPRRWKGMTK